MQKNGYSMKSIVEIYPIGWVHNALLNLVSFNVIRRDLQRVASIFLDDVDFFHVSEGDVNCPRVPENISPPM